MPSPSDGTPVGNWLSRIRVSSDYFKAWWTRFQCSDAIKYYEGTQWAGYSSYFPASYRPYTVNLVYSTIEVQLPSLLFTEPCFRVKPKPYIAGGNPELESQKSRLREAAINTFVTDPDNYFAEEIELAILDSYFAFGLVEVGFTSDFVQNPNAGKPYIKDGKPLQDISGKDIIQPDEIPEWEQVYVKRIHPIQLRVGGLDSHYLSRCSWVAYWEYVDVITLKGNKAFKHLDEIPFAGARSTEFETLPDSPAEMDNLITSGDVVKLWRLWDTRAKRFYIFIETVSDYLFENDYERFPLFPLTYSKRSRGFYPIPPVSQWLSAQDDLNEANEQVRVHRRRGSRKYLFRKNSVDTEDMDKLMLGPDGTYAETEGNPQEVVAPLPLASLEASVGQTLVISKDNFNIVSGTRSEARGEADRTTATQATIVDARSKIRESRPKAIVARWLNRIGREILLQQQNITLPFWVKLEGEAEPLMGGITETQNLYEQITGMDLEGSEFEVAVNITSMSPIDTEEEKAKLFEFLAILNTYPQAALSPTLIREIADKIGFRSNEKVIRELQDMALLSMMGLKAQLQQQVGGLAQQTTQRATPTQMEETRNQIQSQVGLPQNGPVQ